MIIIAYQVVFHPNFNNPWRYFITSCWLDRVGIGQWMNSSIIHDNIYSLIHETCHPKSFHNDINIPYDETTVVPGSIELHLLCHVTLLYCQVDPNPKPKAKSKAKKSLLPLPILPLMWQPLAHLNQCYSSNSLPFLPCGLGLKLKKIHVFMWTLPLHKDWGRWFFLESQHVYSQLVTVLFHA